MTTTSTPQGSLRQRNTGGPSNKKKDGVVPDVGVDDPSQKSKGKLKSPTSSEREYQVGLFLITALAFVTRFWGISHPNEVVFDEVHFGKV